MHTGFGLGGFGLLLWRKGLIAKMYSFSALSGSGIVGLLVFDFNPWVVRKEAEWMEGLCDLDRERKWMEKKGHCNSRIFAGL